MNVWWQWPQHEYAWLSGNGSNDEKSGAAPIEAACSCFQAAARPHQGAREAAVLLACLQCRFSARAVHESTCRLVDLVCLETSSRKVRGNSV